MSTPPPERCVLRDLLQRHRRERPEQVFAWFEDGETWTYAETAARAERLGAALQGLGVGQGDTVLVWLPNGKPALEAYFACGVIGAVYVPINTAYRGALLAHVIENSGARIGIVQDALIARLADVATADLHTIVGVGAPAALPDDLTLLDYQQVIANAGAPAPPKHPIQPWDTQSIVYTSGTTGPSKGVLSSYLHNYASMNDEAWPCVTAEDRFFINMPLFHIGGCFIVYSMLVRGGSIAMTERFRTEHFWPMVRQSGSSAVFLLGAMCSFLAKADALPGEREHPLKTALVVPYNEEAIGFGARFGVEMYTIFNMTEISSPLYIGPNPDIPGICGRSRHGYELRIVDENDIEVPVGASGELILRTARPWALNHGYNRDPEATAAAWRNGWFHTGDAFRQDGDGNFFFVDRIKDAIRRRGENISSFEVESVVIEHDAVQECAAIAVPSEHGEDEVLLVLAAKPGQEIDPAQLIEYLAPRMAHFMVPRYIRIMAPLPKTPTEKIQKAMLRQAGLTADTWDREAAGIRLKATSGT